ncbi:MAG: uncharacterized protein K0Q72_5069 [Armatimonadetes bacterium]|nr:uncharacterized protein [Armatimonadota bacterium]
MTMRPLRFSVPAQGLAIMLTAIAALSLYPAPVRAQQEEPDPAVAAGRPTKKPPRVSITVIPGQANVTRKGRMTPVRVLLQNNGDPLLGRLELHDTYGNDTEMAVDLPRRANKAYTLFAPLAPSDRGPEAATLTLYEGNKALARESLRPEFHEDLPIVLVCTADGANLKFLNAGGRVLVNAAAPIDLPRQWPGYEPADVVVLNGRAWAEMDDEQKRAFRLWVGQGGRAILCGESSTEWRDPEAQSLVGVIPEQPASVQTLTCVTPWAGKPFHTESGSLLTVSGPLQPGTSIPFGQGARPLIVMRDTLRGKVLWLGFDPFRETVRNWEGSESFWRRALQTIRTQRTAGEAPVLAQIPDAVTAARALPRLPAPPLAAILVFGLSYAVIFGPVNIAVLRRLRRTVRAWLFVPALALGMTLVVLFVGQSWGNARTVLNSLTVLNADNGGRTAWEETVTGVFSPTNRSFDLAIEDTAPGIRDLGSGGETDVEPPTELGWPDRQGDGTTGWDQVALQLFATRVLDHWRPRDLGGAVEIKLAADGSGTVTNGTQLPARGAYLVRNGRYCWIGQLDPGATARVEAKTWKGQIGGALPEPDRTGQLRENQLFREKVDRLWRGARDVLVAQAQRKETWLVAEVSDPSGGLRVADVPNNNRAALLLVRAQRPGAGRGGN